MDLGVPRVITALVLQGGYARAHSDGALQGKGGPAWVTELEAQFSLDGVSLRASGQKQLSPSFKMLRDESPPPSFSIAFTHSHTGSSSATRFLAFVTREQPRRELLAPACCSRSSRDSFVCNRACARTRVLKHQVSCPLFDLRLSSPRAALCEWTC